MAFNLPSRGQVSMVTFEIEGEINESDLALLPTIAPTGPPPLKTLKAIHRRQAWLISQGKSAIEVAELVGCTPQRIHQLQKDPTFAELVSNYLDQQDTIMIEDGARFQEKWKLAGEMALDTLTERLEDDAQRVLIPTSELRSIARDASDRTVAPPKAMQNKDTQPTRVTLNFGTNLTPKEPIDITPETPTLIYSDDNPSKTS